MNADADRITRLLSDLLDVSRIDAGRLRLRPRLVDVPALVDRVLAGRVAGGERPGRFVRQDRPRVRLDHDRIPAGQPAAVDGLPESWLDPDRVTQVVSDLVENAVRHGAGTVSVAVGPAEAPDGAAAVELSVAGEGEGVPARLRPRIFSRFRRDGRAVGSRLGLHIVKGIVEAHGGTVGVATAPGGGALSRVPLPVGGPPYGR